MPDNLLTAFDDLVYVPLVAPGVIVELRYASADNGFGRPLYAEAAPYLRRGTALRLAGAQERLRALGYGLKLWDAHRPLAVQRAMWAAMPDEDYVAPPSRGSKHNRGAAVDVTLVDDQGEEVLMPTGFDDFTHHSRHDDLDLPAEAIQHRELLRASMEAAGFEALLEEWWHYADRDWRDYPLCDVPVVKPA